MYKLMEQKVEMGPFERFKVGSGTQCSGSKNNVADLHLNHSVITSLKGFPEFFSNYT